MIKSTNGRLFALFWFFCLTFTSSIGLKDAFHNSSAIESFWALGTDANQVILAYSVLADPRAEQWTEELAIEMVGRSNLSFIPVRLEVLDVVAFMDLSHASDLRIVNLVLFRPLPMRLRLVPISTDDSASSRILNYCLPAVYRSEQDSTRLRDMVDSLISLLGAKGRTVPLTEKEARMICQIYIKLSGDDGDKDRLDHISSWQPTCEPECERMDSAVYINGKPVVDVSMAGVGDSLLSNQHEALSSLVGVIHSEL
jgi:hypothetical protein